MKCAACLLILFGFGGLLAAHSRAQNAAAAPPASTPACLPSTTLDELVKAMDDAITGPADKDRTCFRDLMMPEARLIPLAKGADGSYSPHVLTVDGWIEAIRKRGTASVSEHQIKVSTEVYGHLAHLWSTYETRVEADGKVLAQVRGINSIQVVNDGKRWRIQQVVWQAETPDQLVPAKYLP